LALLLSACCQVVGQNNPTAQAPVEPLPTTTEKAATPATNDMDEAAITFHLSGGLAGVDETWTIYPNGRVVYPEGEEQNLDAAQVATLLDDIEALGFFEMKDSYGQFSQCNDCFTYTLSVSSGGKVKSVSTKEGASDTPPELLQILAKINSLVIKPK
jgi:hypothetical protein